MRRADQGVGVDDRPPGLTRPRAPAARHAAPAGLASPTLAHRKDIDGLRAAAVIPVLLFHAGFPAFRGGFVGVDMFFVISGYLITSIILNDLDADRFSLLAFYERRVRRIFPALLVVLLASFVLGTFVLLPDDLKNLGRSAAGAALSASNILFWSETGYFDAGGAYKPLLHTWSLAVEEQFYLVFPLLLLLLRRFDQNCLRYALPLLVLSFALSVWSVQAAPAAAFYLLPARAWELLLGAVLAMDAVPPPRRQRVRDGLSLLGLGLIALSILTFSPAVPFPGPAALLPCLGAALVIHAGSGGRSLAGRFLGTRPLVQVGLISYSLYLWHWPLLVFARSYTAREPTTGEALAVLLLAFVIAFASWRWIERPFRGRHPILTRTQLFAAAGIATAATAAIGLGLKLAQGLPARLPPEAARLAAGTRERNPDRSECLRNSPEAVRDGRLCRIGAGEQAKPTFILWGDSHAEVLRAAFAGIATRAGQTGLFAGLPTCPPLLGVGVGSPKMARRCRRFNDAVLDLASRDDVGTVILAARWPLYATGTGYGQEGEAPADRGLSDDRADPAAAGPEAIFRRGLERTVAALSKVGKNVVIVGPVPEVGSPVSWTLALASWHGRDLDIRPTRDAFEARNHAVLAELAALERRGGPVQVAYPHTVLCGEDRCQIEDQGRALYDDDNHLTQYGAEAIGPVLEKGLQR